MKNTDVPKGSTAISKKSAAFVINHDMTTDIIMPTQSDRENVYDNTLIVVLLGVLFAQKDEEFFQLIIEKKKQYMPGSD